MALTNLGNPYADLGRYADALPPTEEAVTLYRDLAADNPAYLPDLAMALNNLGNRYADLGRHHDALPPTEEAEHLYRDLATDNPAHRPNLAMALNNLGTRYADLGRHADALPPTEEAVTLYRGLAADNPAYLPNLATALTNLGTTYRELDRDDEAGQAWQTTLDQFEPPARAVLLLVRAQASTPATPAAVGWLADALSIPDLDPALTAALHDQTRRHRNPDPTAFDTTWHTHTHHPTPDWARIDPDLLHTARAWITTPTYTDEHTYLREHPHLLDPTADPAINEALLPLPDEDAERYRTLRHTARTHDIDTAYQPLLLPILATDFAHASPTEQRHLLNQHPHDLLTDTVTDTLTTIADTDDDDQERGAALRAHALLTLAATPNPHPTLQQVWHALDHPDQFPTLLRNTAARPQPDQLHPLAWIALTTADNDDQATTAALHLAIAATLTGDTDQATHWAHQAATWDPNWDTTRTTWTHYLSTLTTTHPTLTTLLTHLTTDTPDNPQT